MFHITTYSKATKLSHTEANIAAACVNLISDPRADVLLLRASCRTSVEMIEKYYASHISMSISAAAVNVSRKVKSKKQIVEHAKRNTHQAE
ncbi:hypothetical protein ACU8OS_31520 (plasmid) [Rhizobium leguminosarum]